MLSSKVSRNEHQLSLKLFNDYKDVINKAVQCEGMQNYSSALTFYFKALEISNQMFKMQSQYSSAAKQKNIQVQQRIIELQSFVSQTQTNSEVQNNINNPVNPINTEEEKQKQNYPNPEAFVQQQQLNHPNLQFNNPTFQQKQQPKSQGNYVNSQYNPSADQQQQPQSQGNYVNSQYKPSADQQQVPQSQDNYANSQYKPSNNQQQQPQPQPQSIYQDSQYKPQNKYQQQQNDYQQSQYKKPTNQQQIDYPKVQDLNQNDPQPKYDAKPLKLPQKANQQKQPKPDKPKSELVRIKKPESVNQYSEGNKKAAQRTRSHSPQNDKSYDTSKNERKVPNKTSRYASNKRPRKNSSSEYEPDDSYTYSDYEYDRPVVPVAKKTRTSNSYANKNTGKSSEKKPIAKNPPPVSKAPEKKKSEATKRGSKYVTVYQSSDSDDDYEKTAQAKKTQKKPQKSRSQLSESKSQPTYNKEPITLQTTQPPLLSNIVVQSDMFKYIRQIGAGSFGAVYLVEEKKDNKRYALKEINSPIISRITEQQLLREIELMNIARHPLVCHLRGFSLVSQSSQGRPPFIVTDYYPNGSLTSVVTGKIKFTPTQKLIALYGIANAMCYLHSLEIVHRDLKPDNVLLDDHFYPIVCDFGLSKLMEEPSLRQTTAAGSPVYMAPELMRRQNYTNSIDVYAYGYICFEVLTGTMSFNEIHDVVSLVNIVCSNKRPPLEKFGPEIVPKNFKSLIKRAWNDNPAERPSFQKILGWYQKGLLTIDGADEAAFNSFINKIPKY